MIICPICFIFYKPDDNLTILKCGHSYHKSCISTWFQSRESGNKCPACRKKHTGKLNPVFLQFEADTLGRNTEVSSTTSGSGLRSFREELAAAIATECQVRNSGQFLGRKSFVLNGAFDFAFRLCSLSFKPRADFHSF